MENVKHRLHEAFKSTIEYVTTTKNISGFLEKGVLTPDEFVAAGDNLVEKCPTWSWESGELSRIKPYLPLDKQYLITRNVPCLRRAVSVEEEYMAAGGEHLVDDDSEGGWLATHGEPSAGPRIVHETIPSMHASDNAWAPAADTTENDNDENIPNMDEFEDDNVVESDPATLAPTYLVVHEPDDENILRTRTYDLTITYDKYYQTPRMWMFGYDEYRQGLAPEQVFEDVSQDHARKTVTIDDHPNLPGKFASVHPCRHGQVMKKIISELLARGGEPRIDQYLFIFLKFIASIIPTIEYDYTIDFDLGNE